MTWYSWLSSLCGTAPTGEMPCWGSELFTALTPAPASFPLGQLLQLLRVPLQVCRAEAAELLLHTPYPWGVVWQRSHACSTETAAVTNLHHRCQQARESWGNIINKNDHNALLWIEKIGGKKLIRTDGLMHTKNTSWISDWTGQSLLFHTPRFWWQKSGNLAYMNSFPVGLVVSATQIM